MLLRSGPSPVTPRLSLAQKGGNGLRGHPAVKNPGMLSRIIRKQRVKSGIGIAHILKQETRDGVAAGDPQQPGIQPREVEGTRVITVARVVLAKPPVLHAEFECMRATYPTEQVVDDVGWPEATASSVAAVAVV